MKKLFVFLIIIFTISFLVTAVQVPSSTESDNKGNMVFTPSQSITPKIYQIIDNVEIEDPFILKGLSTKITENKVNGNLINYTVIFSANITINSTSSKNIPETFSIRISDIDGNALNLKEQNFTPSFDLKKIKEKNNKKTKSKDFWNKQKIIETNEWKLELDGKEWSKGNSFIFNGAIEMTNLSSFQIHFGTNTTTTNFTVAGGNLANNAVNDVFATSSSYYIATSGELAKINRDDNVQIANNTERGYNSVYRIGSKVYAGSSNSKGLVVFDDVDLSYKTNYSESSLNRINSNTVNDIHCRNISGIAYCAFATGKGISILNVSSNLTTINSTNYGNIFNVFLDVNNSIIFNNKTTVFLATNITKLSSNFIANKTINAGKVNDLLVDNKKTLYLAANGGVMKINYSEFNFTQSEFFNLSSKGNVSGWWHFNGNGVDSSENSLTASLTGACFNTTFGKFGGSLGCMDGKDIPGREGVNVPDSDLLEPFEGNFSYETWFYTTAYDANSQYIMIKQSGNHFYLMSISNAGGFGCNLRRQANASVSVHTSNTVNNFVTKNQWHYGACVRNVSNGRATLTTYYDGYPVLSSTQQSFYINTSTGVLQIGNAPNANFNGSIDEARVLKRALTPSEVLENWHNQTYTNNQGGYLPILSGGNNAQNVTSITLGNNNETLYAGIESRGDAGGAITEINASSNTQSFNWTSGDEHEQLVNYSITSLFTDTLAPKGQGVNANEKVLLIGTLSGASSIDLSDVLFPIIVNATITASLTSGETGIIRVNVTDNLNLIDAVTITINTSTAQQFSQTMIQEGSTDFFNTTFEAGIVDNWNFKVIANDTSSNRNNTVNATGFNVAKPVATTANLTPVRVQPFSNIRIFGNISNTDRLRDANATLQVPSSFGILDTTFHNTTQSFNNLSAPSYQESAWYVSVPYNPGNYLFNISWTDYYRNTYNITSTRITVVDLSANVSSLEQNSTAVNSRLNNVQSNVTGLQSNSTSVNNRLNSVQSNVTSLQSNSTAVNSRVNEIQSNVTGLQSNSTAVNSRVNEIQSNVTGLQSNSSSVNNRLNEVQSNVTSLQSNSTAVNTRVNSLQSNTSSVNTNIQALNSTLQSHEQNSTFIDISANPRPTASGNIEFKIFVYDINGLFVNATDMNITVFDANKNKNTGPVDYDSQLSQGVYQYNLTAPSTPEGLWEIEVNASRNGNMFSDRQYFLVVGGPFDVRNIAITDETVETLGATVELFNTGNVAQDIVVNWNLTRTDTGALLDSGQDTVAVGGGQLKNHSVAPSTNYLGSVQITFLGFYGTGFSEKAGAQKTFTTTLPAPSGGSVKSGSSSNSYSSKYNQKTQPTTPTPQIPAIEEKTEFDEEEKKKLEELETEKQLETESNIEKPSQTRPQITGAVITPVITPIQLALPSITSIAYSVIIFMTVLVILIISLVKFAGLKTSFKFEIGYNNHELNNKYYAPVKKNDIFREAFTDKIEKVVKTVRPFTNHQQTAKHQQATTPQQEIYQNKHVDSNVIHQNKPANYNVKHRMNPSNFKQYFPQTYSEIKKQNYEYSTYQKPVQQGIKERVVTIKKEKPTFPKTNNSIIERLKELYK